VISSIVARINRYTCPTKEYFRKWRQPSPMVALRDDRFQTVGHPTGLALLSFKSISSANRAANSFFRSRSMKPRAEVVEMAWCMMWVWSQEITSSVGASQVSSPLSLYSQERVMNI
jgi:hypothetical protein